MAKFTVNPSQLQGIITVPPSKSHTLRAILFGTLANGQTRIHNYLHSPDTIAMIDACRIFGARIDVSHDTLTIGGLGEEIPRAADVINVGNSGITLRFCSAIGALSSHPVVITGDHSIRHQRPMKELLSGLTQLGASAISMRGDDYAPVIVQGPLRSGKATIEGHDSQPVSALLIACAFANGPTELFVENPGEKPWVALTLNWFEKLGIVYTNQEFQHYSLPGKASYPGFDYTVPGDFSSAAFPIAASLITQSELTLKNVDFSDIQGDKELIHVLQKMGARIEIDEQAKSLHVRKSPPLIGMSIDINDFIDALPILAVISCFAEGETRIRNAAVAKQKECNRIECIKSELQKMGADITDTSDGLCIRQSSLKGTQVDSHQDHRMAMALAVAALGATGQSTIHSTECVAKTFPTFANDFITLGANLKVTP